MSRWVLAGVMAILAGGCGTAANRSNATGAAPASGIDSYAHVAQGSCATGEANGKPLKTSCVFTLADGRRFTCPQHFAHVVQTASSLERSAACQAIAPLHLSVAVRRVTASIESAQACLNSHSARAIGNAVLPPRASANSRLRAQIRRSGTVTIFWVRPPTAALRRAVQTCVPGA